MDNNPFAPQNQNPQQPNNHHEQQPGQEHQQQHGHHGHHGGHQQQGQPHEFQPNHQQPFGQHQSHEAQQPAPPAAPPIPSFDSSFAGFPSQSQPDASPGPFQHSPGFAAQPAFTPEPVQVAQPSQPYPQPGLTPQPVVQVLSPRGIEYFFMTIALLTGALGIVIFLLSLINGETDFEFLSFPLALLVVSLPIYAWLFLRLKAAEMHNPSLRLDASKRRSTQLVQVITFVTSFFTLIGFLMVIFAKLGGSYDGSIFKAFLNVLVLLLVSGGILAYYWYDEHRS